MGILKLCSTCKWFKRLFGDRKKYGCTNPQAWDFGAETSVNHVCKDYEIREELKNGRYEKEQSN